MTCRTRAATAGAQKTSGGGQPSISSADAEGVATGTRRARPASCHEVEHWNAVRRLRGPRVIPPGSRSDRVPRQNRALTPCYWLCSTVPGLIGRYRDQASSNIRFV